MLACELDLPIGIDVPLTILSSVLAVVFTFAALASDLLWERYRRVGHRRRRLRKKRLSTKSSTAVGSDLDTWKNSPRPLPEHIEEEEEEEEDHGIDGTHGDDLENIGLLGEDTTGMDEDSPPNTLTGSEYNPPASYAPNHSDAAQGFTELSPTVSPADTSTSRPSSTFSDLRRSSSFMGSTHSSHGLSNIVHMAYRSTAPAKNAFIATGEALYSATISRNKLAEIVMTRKELWKTIAQKENAEQAAAARSDFIASASHEIRTPLHHLQGYSDLLSRTELTEEGRLLLFAIQHATKTLSLITNNVLDWSKLERHTEAACRPISLDMRTVCESILMLLPNRDDADDVDLMAVVSPDVPHSLFLDETYIHRILMNLLSNALKFTRSGYILLLIEMKEDRLIATVKDTGLGIPRSFLPRLFEPFTQAQVRGSQRGTGLGLSIIKQLLEKMRGTIEVESRHADTAEVCSEQTGSTFTVTLPAQRSTSPQDIQDRPEAHSSVAIFQDGNARSAQGLREAWRAFGCDIVNVQEFADLSGSEWKYIWADLPFLQNHPSHLRQLLKQDKWPVLVPYDTQNMLKQLPEVMSATHFITLQKPLIWHSFEERIAASKEPSNEIMTKAVTFAPTVDVLDHDVKEKLQEEPAVEYPTILLVEDNSINQKLGKRMLTALKYQVITADDGEDACQQIVRNDAVVDAILMDQSMPRKDGVSATKDIRAMEAQGILSRRRPIIAVTAVVSAEAQALFTAAGADDFLTKPLSLDRLGKTLATHLPAK
ncbi:hypothetical protein P7C71_g474, partial [Lecanoromycetidae sp. Uapishka_2]